MPNSKHIILGTAGHVDHGKTSLIRALTGVNTDRLREEQERGMSIELGFASFTLPSGIRAGIVDVPGHERFLKNMLAGAGGIDLVLLVVAADEGVMPQTVEHLDILQVLQTKTGLVAITKSDLVDKEWLELVREDLGRQLRGTFLEGVPLLPVSSETGEGLEELVAALDERALAVEPKSDVGPARLPVDRVFTMPGFGTVVTGTLWSGQLRVGESVELQPAGLGSRVRGLQTHGEKVDRVTAGSRVAVNLVGVEVARIERGAVLATPGLLRPSRLLDAQLTLLPSLETPLPHRGRVRLHLGTAEVLGRVALLDRDELRPGETAFVQLQLEEEAVALRGDRFVVRRYSPMATLGGGVVLDPNAARHRRRHSETLDRLGVLLAGGPEDQLLQAALEAGLAGLSRKEAAAALGLAPPEAQRLLEALAAPAGEAGEERLLLLGERYLHADVVASGARRAEDLLRAFHRESPLRAGLSREELKTRVAPKTEARVWNALLDRWAMEGSLKLSGAWVSLPDHEVTFTEEQRQAAEAILEAYRRGGFDPPSEETVLAELPAGSRPAEVLLSLVEQGRLVKLAQGLYLHQEAYDQALATLRELAAQHGSVSVAQMRDALGSSRKVMVPLMEHFDSAQVTRRVGDTRVLLGQP